MLWHSDVSWLDPRTTPMTVVTMLELLLGRATVTLLQLGSEMFQRCPDQLFWDRGLVFNTVYIHLFQRLSRIQMQMTTAEITSVWFVIDLRHTRRRFGRKRRHGMSPSNLRSSRWRCSVSDFPLKKTANPKNLAGAGGELARTTTSGMERHVCISEYWLAWKSKDISLSVSDTWFLAGVLYRYESWFIQHFQSWHLVAYFHTSNFIQSIF